MSTQRNLNFSNQFHDYGLPYDSPANSNEFMTNIRYLEQKIIATTKKLTYWDLYRISAILTDPNAFHSTMNSLLPYSSLVANTNGNTGQKNGDYSVGDIFIKHNDGTYTKIKAERGGIFYPSQIIKASSNDNNYTYQIYYSYQAFAPSTAEASSDKNTATNVDKGKFVCDYAKTMIYDSIKGDSIGSPYNIIYYRQIDAEGIIHNISQEFSLDGKKNMKGQYIEPIVKCFANNNNQLEEVYCDINIDYTAREENTYTVVLDSNAINLITRVVIK